MYANAAKSKYFRIFAWVETGKPPIHESFIAGEVILLWTITIAASAAMIALFSVPAQAHNAPSGWSYPYQCCHDRDCRPIHGTEIKEGPNGYVIKGTGEIVGYTDSRVKNSPDGDYHWCSVAGNNKTNTICLFVPPRSF